MMIAQNKFAGGNVKKVIKALYVRLQALELAGAIKLYGPDDVFALLKDSGDKGLENVASAVKQEMARNKEVLIEGIVPGAIAKPAR